MSMMDEWMDMPPPVDMAAEQSVLGAILIDEDAIDAALEILRPECFYSVQHQHVFEAMATLREDGVAIDLTTLTAKLRDNKHLDSENDILYLTQLASAVPTAANVAHYAELVLEVYRRRKAIKIATSIMRKAIEQPDSTEFLAAMEAEITVFSEQSVPKQEFKSIRNVVVDVVEDAEVRYVNRQINRGVTGIASHFPDLDRKTAGFQRGDLIIVAARPSVGKTAFALNIAQNVALNREQNGVIDLGKNVAIFSLEMSAAQLVQRMVCAEGDVDASRMRTGFFEGDDWEKIMKAAGVLGSSNIFIDDSPVITVNEIRSKCRRLKKEKGLDMILIDYLQLIQGRSRPGVNRQQEVTEISRTLKQIARELDVPVIALSQLSRGVEQRTDKRPMMSDLRESGAIEQDADIVAFLYRDDYYDKETDKKNVIEIIIAKQRNGPVGTVELVFLKQFNKFVSLDRTYSTNPEPPDPGSPQGKSGRIPDMYRKGKSA
ncbi:replicative DNA helicase [Cohnella sp. LGH]|uniref:replicative DNA helicase n=1 Tax=Cohnella sp. LGH TaxID=1619153 RepID=UPI001ADA9661|nr:replicative DNA helicase [Cohnella sp. LGH]QTH44933.1 replicative DNA helicase [Cohnella sp. LGH]